MQNDKDFDAISRMGFPPESLAALARMRLPAFEQAAKDFDGVAEGVEFARRETVEMVCEIRDADFTSFLQQARAFGRSADAHATGVVRVGADFDESAARQPGDDAAHGRRLHLLGGGQLAKCFRASENEHRERGKPRRAFAGRDVLLAQAAQKMNGRGVQAIGDGENVGRMCRMFVGGARIIGKRAAIAEIGMG
jgi:hypothetical protein